jgi:hypothetical protein
MKIPLLGKSTVTVRRQSAGSYVAGEWIKGAEISETLEVSIQPTSGKDREDLPEGYRTTDTQKLYTYGVLNMLDVGSKTPGDIVEFDGSDWEVLTYRDYSRHIAPTSHRKYFISRIGDDE